MGKKKPVTIKAAVISHIGCVRKNNEDNFFFDGDYMLLDEVDAGTVVEHESTANHQMYAVCDGMGGLNGGERAALIGVEAMVDLKRKTERGQIEEEVRAYAVSASEAVYQDAQASNGKKQGCTMCLLIIHDDVGCVANVGDSRVYLMRMGELVQLSRDHTSVYDMYLQGELTREQVRLHPRGNVISHYIGQAGDKRDKNFVYSRMFKLCNGDRFMICSDGLSDLLTHEQMQQMLASNGLPLKAAETMVQAALELGGKDNVTCIVGDIVGSQMQAPTKDNLATLSMRLETTTETTAENTDN